MCSDTFNHALHMETASKQAASVEEIVRWYSNESLAWGISHMKDKHERQGRKQAACRNMPEQKLTGWKRNLL